MIIRLFVAWGGFFCLYLLFAGQLGSTEVGAGIVAAAGIAVFSVGLGRVETRAFRFRAPWAKIILMPVGALLTGSWWVGHVLFGTLWRSPSGALGVLQNQAFQHGDETLESAGRRGLATLAISVAPNGYVVEIDDDKNAMLIHRLVPSALKTDTWWPV